MLVPLELGVGSILAGEGEARSRIGSEVTPRREWRKGENEGGAAPTYPWKVLEGIRAVVRKWRLIPFFLWGKHRPLVLSSKFLNEAQRT